MINFLKKKPKYLVLAVGFVITLLLTIGMVYLNKVVFDASAFKLIKDYSDVKVTINNLFGFAEIIVVLFTFILFIKLEDKE